METEQLRTLVGTAHNRIGGKLWPNGLGFDRRGWTYFYVESSGNWTARHDATGYWGWGETPELALDHARRRRQSLSGGRS